MIWKQNKKNKKAQEHTQNTRGFQEPVVITVFSDNTMAAMLTGVNDVIEGHAVFTS